MQIKVIRTRAGLAAGVPAGVTLPFLFAQHRFSRRRGV